MKDNHLLNNELLEMLVCPVCRNALDFKHGYLRCKNITCRATYTIDEGIPIMIPPHKLTSDLELTLQKWGRSYYGASLAVDLEHDRYPQDSNRFICQYVNFRRKGIYFEAGCGLAKNALLLARNDFKVVGLDICIGALTKAKKIFQRENKIAFFVCGDMTYMSFKDNLFSTIYAAGHFGHLFITWEKNKI